jgi:hypothetical protein
MKNNCRGTRPGPRVLLARDHMCGRGRVGQLRAAQANGLVVVSRFFPNPIQKVGDFRI